MKIEYSLAASYIFLGLAIGMVIWLAGVKIISKEKADAPVAASYRKITAISVVLAVLGIVFAVGHLGRIDRFMNMVSNYSSWLSWEGIFSGGFMGLILVYFLLNKAAERSKYIDLFLYLAALAGIGALVSRNMLYAVVKAIPAWNTPLVIFADSFAALLLGGLLFLVLTRKNTSQSLMHSLTKAIFIVAIVSVVSVVVYEIYVGLTLSALASQGVAVPVAWPGSVLRVLVGLLVPVYLLAKSLKDTSQHQTAIYLTVSLVCVVVGEVTAKIMHYIVAVKGPLF
ncbi:MAG: DmsC/YnfH family molybdoenzyme membrane anchor subunit [Thermacetogeniaceae bacterium]|jgi:DMSO reductase anchor subunit|nr:dimethyl sulfoxide reductase anchor subunit [Syntrophomonadaceae bacterium]